METQNITISLPRALLRRVKVVAAQRDTSISQLVREALEKLSSEDADRSSAHRKLVRLMDEGLDIDTSRIDWARDELHDRSL